MSRDQQGTDVVIHDRTHRPIFIKMLGKQDGLGSGVAKTSLMFIFEAAHSRQRRVTVKGEQTK